LKEIEQFFGVYKSLEGKRSLTFGWSGKTEALKRIGACRCPLPFEKTETF
jgi:hypothetical protein